MGLMGGLQNAFENPLTLGGLSLLSGGGWGGAFQGMRTGAGMQDRRREQELQAQQQQQFRSALDALGEMPPAERALLEAAGVNSAPAFLKHLMDQRDPARQLEMEYKRAQIANLQRQAQAGPDNPSSVREWEYYNSLSPEDQRRYLGMKRAQQFLDTGTGFVPVDPTSPGGTGPVIEKNLSAAEREKAAGRVEGQAEAEARVNLGTALEKADQSIALIDQMLAHPGLSTATGLSGVLDPRNYIAGTDATNFNVMRKQLEGRAFLEAFESLKGGGQITEVEGQKATEAIARLSTTQSTSEYKKALNELKDILRQGKARARRAAGASPGSSAAPSGWQMKRVD